MKLWRLAAGVATWRYGGMKLWRRAASVQARRYVALEARCSRADVEA